MSKIEMVHKSSKGELPSQRLHAKLPLAAHVGGSKKWDPLLVVFKWFRRMPKGNQKETKALFSFPFNLCRQGGVSFQSWKWTIGELIPSAQERMCVAKLPSIFSDFSFHDWRGVQIHERAQIDPRRRFKAVVPTKSFVQMGNSGSCGSTLKQSKGRERERKRGRERERDRGRETQRKREKERENERDRERERERERDTEKERQSESERQPEVGFPTKAKPSQNRSVQIFGVPQFNRDTFRQPSSLRPTPRAFPSSSLRLLPASNSANQQPPAVVSLSSVILQRPLTYLLKYGISPQPPMFMRQAKSGEPKHTLEAKTS